MCGVYIFLRLLHMKLNDILLINALLKEFISFLTTMLAHIPNNKCVHLICQSHVNVKKFPSRPLQTADASSHANLAIWVKTSAACSQLTPSLFRVYRRQTSSLSCHSSLKLHVVRMQVARLLKIERKFSVNNTTQSAVFSRASYCKHTI